MDFVLDTAGSSAPRRERGVTLVEVLVAMLILAFLAVGVTSLLGIAMKQNRLAMERSIASGLAAGRLNQLLSMPYQSPAQFSDWALPGEVAIAGPPLTLSSPKGTIPGFPEYSRKVTLDYDIPATGLLRVQVDVAWRNHGQGQEKVHTMISYLHPGLEGVQ